MRPNEIYKAYGTDYLEMTLRLLERSDLTGEIKKKADSLRIPRQTIRIALKPNVLGLIPPEYGATTHLEVLEGAILYLQQKGYTDIRIMEGAWVGDKTTEAFDMLGYSALADRYGIPLIDTQKQKSFSADCSGLKLNICNCAAEQDFLINLPVLKGHCQTRITCALKNMKGLIPNSEKRRFHTLGLHKPIAHLNTWIHQDFILVDHICGDPDFEEGGDPLVTNCIMTALDPVLVDAYAADILGYRPHEIEYIALAEKLGVGCADLDQLRITVTEGEGSESMPDTHRMMEIEYAIEEIDSCSACYGMLAEAMKRLIDEGILDPGKFPHRFAIGQGYREKSGCYGIGNCTRNFEHYVPGCPPSEEDIYNCIKEWLK